MNNQLNTFDNQIAGRFVVRKFCGAMYEYHEGVTNSQVVNGVIEFPGTHRLCKVKVGLL